MTPARTFVTQGMTTVSAPTLGNQKVVLTAHWSRMEGEDWDTLNKHLPKHASYLQSLSSQMESSRSYAAKDFQVFLPTEPVKVGDLWEVDAARAAAFLTQFHPGASHEGWPDGRGTYAVLRAVSPSHLEIDFRIHAQFKLPANSSLTPGQFAGRLLVNRAQGSVEYVAMKVPTDHVRNVNFEFRKPEHPGVGSVFASRMELVGGLLAEQEWTEEMEPDQARRLLVKRFYPFEEIEWVPFEQALEQARNTNRPVFALVIKGVLNDQSC